MDSDKKIVEFLENGLDLKEERMLFSNMSFDDNLRDDFKGYLKIERGIGEGLESFAPSGKSAAAVFSALAYSIPSTSIPEASTPMAKRKWLSPVLSGLICTISTVIIMLLIFIDKDHLEIHSSSNIPAAKNHEMIKQMASGPVQEENSNSIKTEQAFVPSPKNNYYQGIQETGPEKIVREISQAKVISCTENNLNSSDNLTLTRQRFNNRDFLSIPLTGAVSNLGIETKGYAWWSIPEETISPTKYAKLNNTGIALLYDLNNQVSVGLDLRQETFFAEYRGRESDGNYYQYKQQPNFTSLCAAVRYYFKPESGLNPYAQLSLGGNDAGILFRPAIGLDYYIYKNIALTGGIEYSLFWFKHNTGFFSAQKAGFYYGIKFKL